MKSTQPNQTRQIFDKRQTNIAKGIALLMLLWHHLFFNSPEYYDRFVSMFSIKGIPVESFLAVFCKVCVAIFLFLSGYGLFKSYDSYINKVERSKIKPSYLNDFIFIKNHLIKLMSEYWFIYVIFVLMGFLFNRNPIAVYKGNFLYCIIDFFGLANIFKTPTMNATWWFMSLIILLYILYPLLHRILKWSPEILLLTSYFLLISYFLPTFADVRIFLFPFVFGMYISCKNLFVEVQKQINSVRKLFIVSLLSLIITLWLKAMIFMNSAEIDGFLSLSILLVSFFIISRIPFIRILLESIGKYSGAIFMFHTFIFEYYFKDFIYSSKYSILIFLVMTVVCYIVAILISYIKKVIHFDKLVNKLIKY